MLEHPAHGDVCDADATVAITDVAEEPEEGLKEVPCAPCLQNHIEILAQTACEQGLRGRYALSTWTEGACLSLGRVKLTRVELWLRSSEPPVGEKPPTLYPSWRCYQQIEGNVLDVIGSPECRMRVS